MEFAGDVSIGSIDRAAVRTVPLPSGRLPPPSPEPQRQHEQRRQPQQQQQQQQEDQEEGEEGHDMNEGGAWGGDEPGPEPMLGSRIQRPGQERQRWDGWNAEPAPQPQQRLEPKHQQQHEQEPQYEQQEEQEEEEQQQQYEEEEQETEQQQHEQVEHEQEDQSTPAGRTPSTAPQQRRPSASPALATDSAVKRRTAAWQGSSATIRTAANRGGDDASETTAAAGEEHDEVGVRPSDPAPAAVANTTSPNHSAAEKKKRHSSPKGAGKAKANKAKAFADTTNSPASSAGGGSPQLFVEGGEGSPAAERLAAWSLGGARIGELATIAQVREAEWLMRHAERSSHCCVGTLTAAEQTALALTISALTLCWCCLLRLPRRRGEA